jgi:hypothetical protein
VITLRISGCRKSSLLACVVVAIGAVYGSGCRTRSGQRSLKNGPWPARAVFPPSSYITEWSEKNGLAMRTRVGPTRMWMGQYLVQEVELKNVSKGPFRLCGRFLRPRLLNREGHEPKVIDFWNMHFLSVTEKDCTILEPGATFVFQRRGQLCRPEDWPHSDLFPNLPLPEAPWLSYGSRVIYTNYGEHTLHYEYSVKPEELKAQIKHMWLGSMRTSKARFCIGSVNAGRARMGGEATEAIPALDVPERKGL